MSIEVAVPGIYVNSISELLRPLDLQGPYTFCYSYPLLSETRRVHALSEPTPLDLLSLAARDYASIYRSKIPRTWAHDLQDLVFEGVHIDEERAIIRFEVGS